MASVRQLYRALGTDEPPAGFTASLMWVVPVDGPDLLEQLTVAETEVQQLERLLAAAKVSLRRIATSPPRRPRRPRGRAHERMVEIAQEALAYLGERS